MSQQGFALPLAVVTVVIVMVIGYVAISEGVIKVPGVTRTHIKTEELPKVELKSDYQNPFETKTQYVNPFTQLKNPFDNLQ